MLNHLWSNNDEHHNDWMNGIIIFWPWFSDARMVSGWTKVVMAIATRRTDMTGWHVNDVSQQYDHSDQYGAGGINKNLGKHGFWAHLEVGWSWYWCMSSPVLSLVNSKVKNRRRSRSRPGPIPLRQMHLARWAGCSRHWASKGCDDLPSGND